MRQDGSHEARAIGGDKLGVTDRLTRNERHTGDRAREFYCRVRAVGSTNEIGAGSCLRPCLPFNLVGRQRLSEADVGFRDKHLDGRSMYDLRHDDLVASGRQVGSEPAGHDRQAEDEQACGGLAYAE